MQLSCSAHGLPISFFHFPTNMSAIVSFNALIVLLVTLPHHFSVQKLPSLLIEQKRMQRSFKRFKRFNLAFILAITSLGIWTVTPFMGCTHKVGEFHRIWLSSQKFMFWQPSRTYKEPEWFATQILENMWGVMCRSQEPFERQSQADICQFDLIAWKKQTNWQTFVTPLFEHIATLLFVTLTLYSFCFPSLPRHMPPLMF